MKAISQKYISAAQLRQRFGGVSRMWLHRRITTDPAFPRPVHFGSAARFFRIADVERWERKQIRKSAA